MTPNRADDHRCLGSSGGAAKRRMGVTTPGLGSALLAICLVMNGCTSPSATPAAPDAPSHEPGRISAVVDPIINSELASAGVPGAAFVFVRDGRIVYQKGYGVSDVATGAKVDAERTIWPIASITKAVTAMAALQLVDQ